MPFDSQRTDGASRPPDRRSPTHASLAGFLILATALVVACSHQPTAPRQSSPGPSGPPYQWLNDDPVWSPSGRYMLYNHYAQTFGEAESLGEYQIWRLDLSTGERSYVLPGDQAQWLGGDFLFTLSLPYAGGTYIYTFEHSQVSAFYSCGDFTSDAQGSPDGRTIALYSSCHPESASGILLVDEGTRGATSIPGTFGGVSRFPAWSPDGSRLAVSHWFSDRELMNLCVIDTHGNLIQRLTNDGEQEDRSPTWSRDGSWIYWNHDGANGHESQTGIWRAHPDGTGRELLMHDAWYPSLAPGDSALAFARFDSLNVFDIWIADKDGNHQRPLFPRDDSLAAHRGSALRAAVLPWLAGSRGSPPRRLLSGASASPRW